MGIATVHEDLLAACRAIVKPILTASGMPTDKQAWQGITYVPQVNKAYIVDSLRPIASPVVSGGSQRMQRHTCTYNVEVRFPAGEGTIHASAFAGKLLQAFKPGLPLVYGPTKGWVEFPARRPSIEDAEWVGIPVVITLAADTTD